MIIWEDVSGYSRDDKNKVPNIWNTIIGDNLYISVVYNHILYPGQWIFSCVPFFEHEELGDVDTQTAQDAAIDLVKLALHDTLAKLKE